MIEFCREMAQRLKLIPVTFQLDFPPEQREERRIELISDSWRISEMILREYGFPLSSFSKGAKTRQQFVTPPVLYEGDFYWLYEVTKPAGDGQDLKGEEILLRMKTKRQSIRTICVTDGESITFADTTSDYLIQLTKLRYILQTMRRYLRHIKAARNDSGKERYSALLRSKVKGFFS